MFDKRVMGSTINNNLKWIVGRVVGVELVSRPRPKVGLDSKRYGGTDGGKNEFFDHKI